MISISSYVNTFLSGAHPSHPQPWIYPPLSLPPALHLYPDISALIPHSTLGYNRFVISKFLKKKVTISDYLYPQDIPRAYRHDLGLEVVANPFYAKVGESTGAESSVGRQKCIRKQSPSSSSRHPIDRSHDPLTLKRANPLMNIDLGSPLRKKKSDSFSSFVDSLVPFLIISVPFFGSYSIADFIFFLEKMGMDPIWLKDMLGLILYGDDPVGLSNMFCESDIGVIDPSEVQDLSEKKKPFLLWRLLLVSGSLVIATIVFWQAANGG